MCRRITCRQCGKPSFTGCGQHVEQVLGDVPRSQRCTCGSRPVALAGAATRPTSPSAGGRSLIDRLLRRG